MSVHQPTRVLQDNARRVRTPVLLRRHQPTFDLHPAVHVMLATAWVAFIAILALAFMGSNLVMPAVIFAFSVPALFVVPGLWARVAPDDGLPRQSWDEFMRAGVVTQTGRLETKDALAQMFTLPILILGLAFVFVIIKLTL